MQRVAAGVERKIAKWTQINSCCGRPAALGRLHTSARRHMVDWWSARQCIAIGIPCTNTCSPPSYQASHQILVDAYS